MRFSAARVFDAQADIDTTAKQWARLVVDFDLRFVTESWSFVDGVLQPTQRPLTQLISGEMRTARSAYTDQLMLIAEYCSSDLRRALHEVMDGRGTFMIVAFADVRTGSAAPTAAPQVNDFVEAFLALDALVKKMPPLESSGYLS